MSHGSTACRTAPAKPPAPSKRPTSRGKRRDATLLRSLLAVHEAAAALQAARLAGDAYAIDAAAAQLAVDVPRLTEDFMASWEARMSSWRRARRNKRQAKADAPDR